MSNEHCFDGTYRNYKDSFIWCDLFDDDCILPLSATGEYVLKAMELFDASSPGGLKKTVFQSLLILLINH